MNGDLKGPSREALRDKHGQVVGHLDRLHYPGRVALRDPDWTLLGTFDPSANETRDANLNLIGIGNLLGVLLVRS